jgi:hypothetical protein
MGSSFRPVGSSARAKADLRTNLKLRLMVSDQSVETRESPKTFFASTLGKAKIGQMQKPVVRH